jgi:hypothetical protein
MPSADLKAMLYGTKILPILSDPTSEDGDGDDIYDKVDIHSLLNDDEIPLEFKKYINNEYVEMDLIYFTNDGFAMCNKSLADLLNTANIYEIDNLPVQNWYDDWYVYAVTNEGATTFSLLKMREVENDYIDGIADLDTAGVAISFAKFNIDLLSDSLSNQVLNVNFDRCVDSVTQCDTAQHDSNLQLYFSKTSSCAPYLIAEAFINKIVQSYDTNTFTVPSELTGLLNEIEQIDFEIRSIVGVTPNGPEQTNKINLEKEKEKLIRIPNALEIINEKSNTIIYDYPLISINNKQNLSLYEKQIILSVYTADISFNMFAAEVQFHAEALDDWKQNVPIKGEGWYKSAVIADMALGEDDESGGFDQYYNPNNSLVKNQRSVHGDY